MGPSEAARRLDMDGGASGADLGSPGAALLSFLVSPRGRFLFQLPAAHSVAIRDRKVDVDSAGAGRLASSAPSIGTGGPIVGRDPGLFSVDLLRGQLVFTVSDADRVGSRAASRRGAGRNLRHISQAFS